MEEDFVRAGLEREVNHWDQVGVGGTGDLITLCHYFRLEISTGLPWTNTLLTGVFSQ